MKHFSTITFLAFTISVEILCGQKPIPDELYFSAYSPEVQAALDQANDTELQSLLSRGMTDARSDIMHAIRFRPIEVQIHVLDMALAEDSLWPIPEIGIGEDKIAQRAFRVQARATISTLLPNLPEFDLGKAQDRAFLRQKLAAILAPPPAAAAPKQLPLRTTNDTQLIGDLQTPAISPKQKPLATTAALPEIHSPPHIIFWLGLTILAAVAGAWLAMRSPKRR